MQGAKVDLRVPDLAALHERRSDKWAGHAPDVLVATIAEMDFPLAAPIAAALHAAVDRHDVGYAPSAPRRLFRTFADFAGRRLRWTVDDEQVTLVPDVMDGLIELCRVLLGPGEAVTFATPAYPPFIDELPQAAERVEEVPLEADGGLDLDALEAAFVRRTRVLVLANPHNPTGRVLRRDELAAIAELCAAHRVWVLADEIHAPLTLAGAEHVPWLEVSEDARAWGIAVTSASKAFNVAGLKAALAVTASGRARDAVARLPDLSDRAGLLGVVAAEAAFSDGDEWLDAVLAQTEANRTLLGKLLPTQLPGIRWTPPEASYLAWLDCRGSGSGTTPPPSSSKPAGSRSAQGSTTAAPARVSPGSTSARVRRWSPRPSAASLPRSRHAAELLRGPCVMSAGADHRRAGVAGRRELDRERDLTELDDVAVLQIVRRRDASAVDERAIRGAEVQSSSRSRFHVSLACCRETSGSSSTTSAFSRPSETCAAIGIRWPARVPLWMTRVGARCVTPARPGSAGGLSGGGATAGVGVGLGRRRDRCRRLSRGLRLDRRLWRLRLRLHRRGGLWHDGLCGRGHARRRLCGRRRRARTPVEEVEELRLHPLEPRSNAHDSSSAGHRHSEPDVS